MNMLDGLSETRKWRLMVAAAKKGATDRGYSLSRRPGRGLSNIFEISKGGQTTTAAVRTTRDRWFAFPPLAGGTKWKTLDEVEMVIVAAVDSKEAPQKVEVYIFPAEEVRRRFIAAHAARIGDGQRARDNFGMWVNLDPDDRGIAASVGSGIAKKYPAVAVYEIADLLNDDTETDVDGPDGSDLQQDFTDEHVAAPSFSTIPEVVTWTRQHIARLAGVPLEAVRLDLKIEY